MRDPRFRHLALLALVGAILASACASDEEPAELVTTGVPQVSEMCAEDAPDCLDTLVGEEPPTGGDLPPAPEPEAPDSAGFVVGGGLSVSEALAYDGTEVVAVSGFIVGDSGNARLCEALAESYPPQCGGVGVVITNPEVLTDLPLVEAGDTQWSEEPVTLFGTLVAGELTVATNVSG